MKLPTSRWQTRCKQSGGRAQGQTLAKQASRSPCWREVRICIARAGQLVGQRVPRFTTKNIFVGRRWTLRPSHIARLRVDLTNHVLQLLNDTVVQKSSYASAIFES